jgi:hypothetical protein
MMLSTHPRRTQISNGPRERCTVELRLQNENE